MNNNEECEIGLHIEDEDGNLKIETVTVSKATKEFFDKTDMFPEDALNHMMYTDLLSVALMQLEYADALNTEEMLLLETVVEDALKRINTMRYFDTESLNCAINNCIINYLHSDKDVSSFNSDAIVEYYNKHNRYTKLNDSLILRINDADESVDDS